MQMVTEIIEGDIKNMIYLIEIFKGFLISIGIILGFISVIVIIIYKSKNKGKTYVADELIDPFEIYLKKIVEREQYEEVENIKKIIKNLKKGITEGVDDYKIKDDFLIKINTSSDEDSEISFKKQYIIYKK